MNTFKDEILKEITVIGTDDICSISMAHQILEEKLSLLLLDCKYRGAIPEYTVSDSFCGYRFNYFDAVTQRSFPGFRFSDDNNIVELFPNPRDYQQYDPIYWDCCVRFKDSNSLYQMLSSSSRYTSIGAAAKFLGTSPTAYAPFKLNGKSLKQIPIPVTLRQPWEKDLSVDTLRAEIVPFFTKRFPADRKPLCSDWNSHFGNDYQFVYDFCDENGTVFQKLLKLYSVALNGQFYKYYLPLTAYLDKKTRQTHLVTVPMPQLQPLFNLDYIVKADSVVVCSSVEDAYILQEKCKDKRIAYTAFWAEYYAEIDFAPLAEKDITLLISNYSGMTLAEAYEVCYNLSEHLKNAYDFADINYVQRAISYPDTTDVRSVKQLIHTTAYPHIVENSIRFMDEAGFLMMYEKAKQEIGRKNEQSKDQDFWADKTTTIVKSSEDDNTEEDIYDKLLLRPMFGRGTINYISGERGVGKSCFVTALCGHMLGSSAPFIEERCWTACTQPDGTKLNCIHLVFDTDGAPGITQHKHDFADYLSDIKGHYIVEDMGNEDRDYSNPENYDALISRIKTLKNDKGNADGLVDILVIDTLLALGNDTDRGYTVINRLKKSFPEAVILVVHHLNKSGRQYGTEKKLGHVATAIELIRDKEQKIEDSAPTLHDPIKLVYTKTRNSHIPEDNEAFCLKLDEKGHFVVHNPVRSKEDMRRAVASRYAAKKIEQKKIGRLFDVSDRTIRTWLAEDNQQQQTEA